MAKIGVRIGFTIRLDPRSQVERVRPDIGIEGVDTDKPIRPQIEDALKAIDQTWDAVIGQSNEKILLETGIKDDVKRKLVQEVLELKQKVRKLERKKK